MNQVRDLTTDAIGKVYRIQNDDGAYIEGTVDTLSFVTVNDDSKYVDVLVTFKELKTSYKEGAKRLPIFIYTKPQHSAVEIVENDADWRPPPPPLDVFGATRGPGINGKLYDEKPVQRSE